MAKKTPALNTSSTADIAFLLLCYFLMTTTMGSQTGLQRRLPPMPDPNQKVEDQKVNKRNLITVKINSQDRLLAGTEMMDVSQLKDKIKIFLTNPANDATLPERVMTPIEGYGQYPVSKGVISLQNDRGTSYRAYIAVQNELVKAVNELRDEFSKANYGKPFANLTEDQQDIVFGHYIDYFQLKAVIPQQKILVLRMDIDQPAPQFLHHGERDRRIVYKSTRFSRCKQLPAKDANLRIIFQVIREKEFFQFIAGNIEDCFYHTFFRTFLNALSIRTLSQNQGKSTQYNGLSCTRLTGYHRKTFVELNVQAVYQNKVPYE